MTKVAKILFYVFASTVLLSSCSFEKRLYNKGYHIDWASKKTVEENASESPKSRRLDKPNSPVNNHPMEVTTNTNTSQDFVSPLNKNYPTENNNNVLASGKTIVSPVATTNRTFETVRPETKVSATDVLPKNKRLIKKLFRRGADDTVLYVLLALLIPPLAMVLYEGKNWTDRCTLNLILTVLCWLPGVIHALYVILDNQ
ncbi:MAG: YqaE/Pmp3 family membrane protein [Bacteroidota bacterium]